MASRPNRAESKRLQKQISDSSDSSAGQSLVSDTPPGGVQWGSIANTNGVRELVPARSSTLPGDSDGGSPDPTDSTFALLPRDVDPASCPQSVDVEVDVISETTLEDDGVSQHVKEKSRICRAFSSLFLCTLTRREKLIVMSIAIVNLTSQMCLSIMAPFFPIEASHKGVSTTISGWIFGVFALVQFLTSPLFGKILPRLGSRLTISAGQLFSGLCVLLFGFLDAIDDYTLFVSLCMLLRILLAFGCSASETACFAVTANVFPTAVATVLGTLETAIGLGMMIGPAIGGILYQVGGFRLPFFVLGSSMMLFVPLLFYSLPVRDDDNQPKAETISLLQILRIPTVIVVCLAIFVAALVWSLFDPILAPHLEKFNVNPAVLGLLFLLISTFYAVFSPLWGGIADRVADCSPMLVTGFLILSLSLLLLGPSPWLGFGESDNFMWLNVVSLGLLGISESLAIVPTFNKILDGVEKAGFKDSFAMFSVVSGIWSSCYALGDFAGPALGGWLADRDGFPRCLSYVAVICLTMFFNESPAKHTHNSSSLLQTQGDLSSWEVSNAHDWKIHNNKKRLQTTHRFN